MAVTLRTFANPTVSFEKKIYPAFSRGNNTWAVFIPTTPLDTPGTKSLLVSAESEVRQISLNVADRSFPTQRIWLPERNNNEPLDEYEFDRVDEFKALVTPEKHWRGALLRPTTGEVTTGYGVRRYYNGVFAEDYYHRGVDYGADVGEPVIAPAAGRISLVGRANQRFNIHGNTVGIDHGQGLTSIMLHLSRIDVQAGDFVQAGQAIGRVGATGAVTGPHLHWGLYVHGAAIDPVPWRQGDFN
jgi:murein DD-endopeptidase MepM/ murein hydrolase activator NlpD